MLPAFTGALLGATAIRPGRPNVWGTLLAVAVLAVAVAGLTQLGAPFFVENLFNGAMLVLAVGLAVVTHRRREQRAAASSQLNSDCFAHGRSLPIKQVLAVVWIRA
jgi:ribose transport system permease protein